MWLESRFSTRYHQNSIISEWNFLKKLKTRHVSEPRLSDVIKKKDFEPKSQSWSLRSIFLVDERVYPRKKLNSVKVVWSCGYITTTVFFPVINTIFESYTDVSIPCTAPRNTLPYFKRSRYFSLSQIINLIYRKGIQCLVWLFFDTEITGFFSQLIYNDRICIYREFSNFVKGTLGVNVYSLSKSLYRHYYNHHDEMWIDCEWLKNETRAVRRYLSS